MNPVFDSRLARDDEAARLGHAIRVLAASARSSLRLASIIPFLLPPIRLGQIEFGYNSHGFAMAYATWAFLSDDVAAELETDPDRLLSLEEWNEGTHLWVMDIVALDTHVLRPLLRRVREMVPDHEQVSWRRHDRSGVSPRQLFIGTARRTAA